MFYRWMAQGQEGVSNQLTLPPPWATTVPRSSTSSTKARKTLQGEDKVGGWAHGSGRQALHSQAKGRKAAKRSKTPPAQAPPLQACWS